MTSPQRRRNADSGSAARVSKAERRRQLLNHAKHQFATLGYRAATLPDIAAAAGVTETALARHFENKKALFEEVLHEIRAATLQRWQTDTISLPDPAAKLHTVAGLYLGSAKHHPVEFRILHRTLSETDDEDVLRLLRAFYLEVETFLAQIIAEGQQSGVFRRSLDPRVGAWELIRTALGHALTHSLGVPLHAEPDYLPRTIECLLHCLLKTDV
jgi:AcrR family transcriptional regulator